MSIEVSHRTGVGTRSRHNGTVQDGGGTDDSIFLLVEGTHDGVPFSRKFKLDNPGDDREQGQTDTYYVQPSFPPIFWSAVEQVGFVKEIDNPITSKIHGDWLLEWVTFKFALQNGQVMTKQFSLNRWFSTKEMATWKAGLK